METGYLDDPYPLPGRARARKVVGEGACRAVVNAARQVQVSAVFVCPVALRLNPVPQGRMLAFHRSTGNDTPCLPLR